ncbi:hypothetical protein Fcan01_24609 [Folsomia candida]|uniref:Uncharacterized protein n=1 Tax=Folsomia candida TaxID=158441 RepID=A0A226D682_FOLCA|nr:hypothetical protein Fcan01_24609 [Folsomia candida]
MGSSTLSNVVIPAEDKLKLWTVFRNVRAGGEEILKTAKLVHVHDKEGFVVTKTDKRIQSKAGRYENYPNSRINLLLEQLPSQLRRPDSSTRGAVNSDTPIDNQMKQLGRFSYFAKDGCTPLLVVGLRKRKVRKVALQGVGKGRVVALAVGGDVYHWGTIGDITILAIRLMDKEQWNFEIGRDFWTVTSVGCSFGAKIMLKFTKTATRPLQWLV